MNSSHSKSSANLSSRLSSAALSNQTKTNQKGFSTMTTTNNNKQAQINKQLAQVNRLFNQAVKGNKVKAEMSELKSASVILDAIATFPGLGVKTKNYEAITAAMAEGHSLRSIMLNPELTGVAKNQYRYFRAFMDAKGDDIPEMVMAPTRKRVRTVSVDLLKHSRNEAGEVVLNAEVNFQSQSQLADAFGSLAADDKSDLYLDMAHVVYIDLNIADQENQELKDLQVEVVRNGFYYSVDGVTHKANFFIQTASQARQLQGIYIAEDFMTIPQAFKKLGHDFLAYCKLSKDGIYTLDITKYLKRPGLSGTSSVSSKAITFPNARISKLANMTTGEYLVESDRHTMAVIEDRFAKITNGTFKAFYNNRVVTVSAVDGVFTAQWKDGRLTKQEVLPMNYLKLGVGDGLVLASESIYWALKAEHGNDSDAWQVRITPFVKGLMVFVPGLRKYYDADIVAFKSAVKGDFRLIADEEGRLDFNIELRIARFAKRPGKKAEYVELPYQFAHVSSITAEQMINVAAPRLEEARNVLSNPALIQKYTGVAHLEDLSKLTTAEAEFMRDRSLVSVFANFMHYAPFTYEDAYMQTRALQLMGQQVDKWVAGTIPVEGEYRFMVQDPYALLQAVADEDGDMIVPASVGLRPHQTFMTARDNKHFVTGPVASFRNPAIAKGEGRVLKGAAPENYVTASAKGAFNSVCIMSCHDLDTFAEGGADNDGDETFVTQVPEIVNSIMGKDGESKFLAMLDLHVGKDGEWASGCPFPMESDEKLTFGAACVDHDGQFKVKFTADQYDDAFIQAVHELSKEYVIRTLNPNKIGQQTNIATRLADAVRKVGYMYAEGVDEFGQAVDRTEAEKQDLLHEIVRMEEMIDLVRLTQGWEIDRAKHGGAYEEALAAELNFINNPPKYAGFQENPKAKRVWIKQAWLSHHKGTEGGIDTGSVMSRVHNHMKAFVQENVIDKSEEIKNDVENNNIIHVLRSEYAIDANKYEALAAVIRSIRASYTADLMNARNKNAEFNKLAEIKYNGNDHAIRMAKAKIERIYSEDCDAITFKHQAALAALELSYSATDIGYVSYMVTYTERGKDGNRSISFPWVVAKKQFLELCAKIANREIVKNPYLVPASEIKANFRIAEDPRSTEGKHYDGMKMAEVIKQAGSIEVMYTLNEVTGVYGYVAFVPVGSRLVYVGDFYQDQVAFMTGATHFELNVSNAEAKGQAMTLTVSSVGRK